MVGRGVGPDGGLCAGDVVGLCAGVVDGVVELLRGHHSGSWDRRRWKSGSWWA